MKFVGKIIILILPTLEKKNDFKRLNIIQLFAKLPLYAFFFYFRAFFNPQLSEAVWSVVRARGGGAACSEAAKIILGWPRLVS